MDTGVWPRGFLRPPPPCATCPSPNVPPAPHLEDCAARTAARRAAEERGEGGTPLAWAREESGECCGGSGGSGEDGRGCCNCGPNHRGWVGTWFRRGQSGDDTWRAARHVAAPVPRQLYRAAADADALAGAAPWDGVHGACDGGLSEHRPAQ
ncbi:hypothetical protein CLOM_g22351 [Closterium sp. NIES-68]|nr:hypothetical protein CLOM_g22351 [Closterium sp. NIES-68]